MNAIDMLAVHAERCPTCSTAADPSGFCADGNARWLEVVRAPAPLVLTPAQAKALRIPVLPVMFRPTPEDLQPSLVPGTEAWSDPGGDPVADMQTAFDKLFGK